MRTKIVLFAALAASPLLFAQDDKGAPPAGSPQMPNPKVKQHELLAMFAGDWESVCKTSAMPGVPDMDKPSESTGTEHAELICDGVWLKSTINGTHKGKPFQGVWLAGYDPFQKHYAAIWVSNQDEPSCSSAGTYDAKSKTWTFTGKSPMGPVRNTYVFKDADNSTETCFVKAADGKETQCMQIVRKRGRNASARDATATTATSPENAVLAEGVGNWQAVVTHSTPGQPPAVETCTELVVPICEGRWVWSDFKGHLMGTLFEGHALTGYDAKEKKFVSFWIDSCSATSMRTSGTYDAGKKVFTYDGECVDDHGKPMTVHQVATHKDQDTRTLEMTFKGADATHEMKIDYKRIRG